jgi:serine/threonine-protein kinase
LRLLTRLLVEVPDTVPPEAERELAESASRGRETGARISAGRYLTWFAFLFVLATVGVRSYVQALTALAFIALASGYAYYMYRRGRTGAWHGLSLLALSSIAVSLLSTLLGPFVLVPGLASTNTVFFSLHADRRARWIISAFGALTMLVPAALELLHVVPPSYVFANGSVTILPRMTDLPAQQTLWVMVATSVALVITPTFVAGRVHDALAAAERRLFMQAWQLRQLVPDEALPARVIAKK